MLVISNLFIALAKVTDLALSLYTWVLIIRALISWVNPDPFNPIVQFLQRVTDPVLSFIKRFIPPLGGIDISPVIAILIIGFLRVFLVQSLFDIGFGLR